MLEPVSHDTQRKGLNPGDSLPPSGAVGHHTRQVGYFRDPTSIFLSLDLQTHSDHLRKFYTRTQIATIYANRGN